jgi:hypothetical protein
MCTTAALELEYGVMPDITRSPWIDAMLTIEPPRPACFQRRAARTATSQTPRTLIAINSSNFAVGRSSDTPSLAFLTA